MNRTRASNEPDIERKQGRTIKLRSKILVLAVFLVIMGYLCFEHESQSRIVGQFAIEAVTHLVEISPVVDSELVVRHAFMASKKSYAVDVECLDTGTSEQVVHIEMRGPWNHRVRRTLQLQYDVENVVRSEYGDVYLLHNTRNSQAVVFTKRGVLPGEGVVLAIRRSSEGTIRFDWVSSTVLQVHFINGEWSVIDDRKLFLPTEPGDKVVFLVRENSLHLRNEEVLDMQQGQGAQMRR